ncbi:MAG: L,D-transpeptidase [Candidatus Dormibacteraeota bacterium]|nr:L,D-transpeptidase [Candidatus Dormibacteraeota bacterium]MBO0761578.1 L,D-transpeptidase [Candidatus Dormibacteraeota bacterium]
MKRLVVIPVIVLLALVAGTGCGNAYVFDQHAGQLEREWQQEQAVGVSAAELAPLRAQLAGLEARRMGPVPTSNALVGDPFARLEQQTRGVHAQAMDRSRGEAQTALQNLKAAYGPTPFTEASTDQRQLTKASEPGQLQQLAKTWTQDAAGVTQTRDQLATKSGGLTNGLPTDIMTGVDQVQRDVDQAKQLNLWTDPGESAVQGASTYLGQSYDAMLAQHDGAAKQLHDAASTLQQRMTLERSANGLLQQLPSLLQDQAGTDASTQADKAKQALNAAKTDGQLNTAVSELQSVVSDLKQKRTAAQTTTQQNGNSAGCIPNAPGKLIIVHLATQQLAAYENGCPVLTTLVTTGQAALPTDRGTFQIFAKYPKYKMVSPWPKGNPYWYPDTYVYNAMEFVDDGTFIHSADWQPANGYGPGSQNGPFASHGCVHVPDAQLQKLYDWAGIGTTVTVTD